MITSAMYKEILGNNGKNLSQVRKKNSAMIMNKTFTGDVDYKRVYILDKEKGWIWTDAKYSKHVTPSILRDAADYYLQFRPYEHYPVGTYVFIPNDTSNDLNFSVESPSNPFKDPNFVDPSFDVNNQSNLWLLVGRNDANEFVRYNILKCNWNFKWIYKLFDTNRKADGKDIILSCFGAARFAASYTSGVWNDDSTVQLDQIISAWLPDINYIYQDKRYDYELDDTRLIRHDERFMMSTNILDSKVYKVTKINEMSPKGILKITFKQDEYDERRDNAELLICNYYSDSGEIQVEQPEIIDDPMKTSTITYLILDSDGNFIPSPTPPRLHRGDIAYFRASYSSDDVIPDWRTELIYCPNKDVNEMTETQLNYYCNLLKLTTLDNDDLQIKVAKAKSIIGCKFKLSFMDQNGNYYSTMDIEVIEDEA